MLYKAKTIEGLSVSLQELRLCCIRILGYYLSLPTHYARFVEFSQSVEKIEANKVLSAPLQPVSRVRTHPVCTRK